MSANFSNFFKMAVPVVAMGLPMFMLNSCCGGKGDVLPTEGPIMPTKALVEQYVCKNALSSTPDGFDAYMDFSGIVYAMDDATTSENFKSIVNKITGEANWSFYSLADKKIETLEKDQTKIYNMMTEKENFGKLYAPIEESLKKIVANGKPALLVTDYEEYTTDGKIQHQNYPKPYFKQWVEQGGEITFYVTNYKENGQDKHLYYTIFDTPEHQLVQKIDAALQGKTKNYEVFTISNNILKFTTEYATAEAGGTYHSSKGSDDVTVAIEDGKENSHAIFASRNAEYYPLAAGKWEDALTNAKGLSDPAVPAADRYAHLLSKLYVDLSNTDSYIIDDFDVVVYDVQDDFEKYSRYMCGKGHAPEKKVAGNETYFEFKEADKPFAAYYDATTGAFLPQFDYTKGGVTPPQVNDFLAFSTAEFNQSVQKGRNKVALAFDFHPNFTGAQAQVNRLYRVDLVVKKCTANISDENLDKLFHWGDNNCLRDAVRNTLDDMNPTGKAVYSYYIYMM